MTYTIIVKQQIEKYQAEIESIKKISALSSIKTLLLIDSLLYRHHNDNFHKLNNEQINVFYSEYISYILHIIKSNHSQIICFDSEFNKFSNNFIISQEKLKLSTLFDDNLPFKSLSKI